VVSQPGQESVSAPVQTKPWHDADPCCRADHIPARDYPSRSAEAGRAEDQPVLERVRLHRAPGVQRDVVADAHEDLLGHRAAVVEDAPADPHAEQPPDPAPANRWLPGRVHTSTAAPRTPCPNDAVQLANALLSLTER
jgi:hypothetical protein